MQKVNGMSEVKDKALLDQLNAPSGTTEVTDQALINQLNGTNYNGTEVEPSQLKSGDQLGGAIWDGTQFVQPEAYKPKPTVEDIYNSKRAAIRNTAALGQPNLHQGSEHTTSSGTFGIDAQNELLARSKGPDALARYNDVMQMGPIDKAMISAGRETDKLLSGVNSLGYGLAGMAADRWNTQHPSLVGPEASANMIKKMNAVDEDQASKDAVMGEFLQNQGIPGYLGSMLPYIASGATVGRTAGKIGEEVLSTLSEAPMAAVNEGKGAFTKLVEKIASNDNPFASKIGGRFKTEITDPWTRRSAYVKLRPKISDPYTQGLGGEILGGTTLGAIESALHPDQSWWEGALSSGVGSSAGAALKPYVTRMPDFRAGNTTEKDLLKWGEEQGLRYLPGMESGSKRLQKFEHAMRSDSQLGDSLALYDNANAIVNNRIAANTMGMSPDVVNSGNLSLTPKVLQSHLADIGNQYDALEAGTIAHFRPQDINDIRGIVNRTIVDKTIDPSIGKLVKGYADKIMAMAPSRDPLTGRLKSSILEGDNYKEIRRNLRSDINDAYSSSDTRKAEALKPLLQHVDDAVERGVQTKGGTSTVAQWKDLNERNAMTNLILEHGMTPTGQFAPEKIMNHLMGSDTKRLLTDQGGRVKDLQKVAKLAYMDRMQEGSDLTGMGVRNIANAGNPGLVEKLLMTPMAGYIPIGPRVALAAYKTGWPVKTGLLNMSGKDLGRLSLYTRAAEQATQPYPKAINYVEGQGRAIKKKMTEAEKWINEKYKSIND